MLYKVRHSTHYTYSEPVSICHNEVYLVPRTSLHQSCVHYNLSISPTPSVMSRHVDYFGNDVTYFTLQEMHRNLDILMESMVEVQAAAIPEPESTLPWERVAAALKQDGYLDAYQFVFDSTHVHGFAELQAYARESFPAGRPVLEGGLDLIHRIHRDFKYDTKFSTIGTPVEDIFRARKGVCQDFAHLALACLRGLGLSARYVSGYLQTTPPPGRPRLVGADASHAWISVYCLDDGWIDLDPTNDLIPKERHITLAWGRDYADVSPIKGVVLGGGEHDMHFSVDVVPIAESHAAELPPLGKESQLLLPMVDDSL